MNFGGKLANFGGNLAKIGKIQQDFVAELRSDKWIWATLVDFGMSVWVIPAQILQMCPLFCVAKGLQLWTPKHWESVSKHLKRLQAKSSAEVNNPPPSANSKGIARGGVKNRNSIVDEQDTWLFGNIFYM